MRNLKLIWDFKGPDALKIAQHHEIHLKEYIELKKDSNHNYWYRNFK